MWHPAAVSDVFSKLQQRLEETLSRLKATGDPVLRRHLLAEIRLLLKEAETLVSIDLSQQSLPPKT
jgi:TATA-binding protein-associated factor Taf7